MTEGGFKPKLTAILIADFKDCSRLTLGPEKPVPPKLTPFSASKTILHGITDAPVFIGQLNVMKGNT